MKKDFLFYINRIVYIEAPETPQDVQPMQNVSQPQSASVPNTKTMLSQRFKDLFSRGGEKSLNVKDFLNSLSEKGNDNLLLKKLVNRIERKRDPETEEDIFIKSKIEDLNKNPELRNSILNFIKTNSDLDIEQLKQKFEKEDLINKKNLFKQILSEIQYFKSLPENEKSKILETYGKELAYDTVENVVNYFLKDEAKKKIEKMRVMAKNKALTQQKTPQQNMPQQKIRTVAQKTQPPEQRKI